MLIYVRKINVIHIKNLKKAFNHGIVLKNVHKVITFYEKVA